MKICPCDPETTHSLRRIAGTRILWIALEPYPQSAAYRQAVIATNDISVIVNVVETAADSDFCTETIKVHSIDKDFYVSGWDLLEFADFRIDGVCMVRKKVWQRAAEPGEATTIGVPRSVQFSGGLEAPADDDTAALVDTGIILSGSDGSEIALVADDFPLLIRFEMDSSVSIIGDRIALTPTNGARTQ